MNIASNGNLATDVQSSDSGAGEEESESDASVDNTTVDNTAETAADTTIEKKEEKGEGPFSYVGSSSGIYLLSRMFKDGQPEDSESLPRPVDGDEDDLMIANFNGRSRLSKGGFSKPLKADWKLPPKELTDHLIDM